MKPKNYKELHRQHTRAGVFTEATPTARAHILAQWDADTSPPSFNEKKGPGRYAREITAILESEGVDIKDIPPLKLAAYLNGNMQFNQLHAILSRSIPDSARAFKVGEALFHLFRREAPLSAADYKILDETQKRLMPDVLKENEAGFVAKEWIKGKLRPLIARPLMMSLQQHTEDVRRLNDEAYRKQNFLDDGLTPAGVQHVLKQRRESGDTLSGMTDAPEGSDSIKPLAQIKSKLLSIDNSDPLFAQYEVMARDIIGNQTSIDLRIPGVFMYPTAVRKEKRSDGTITLHSKGEKIVFSKDEHNALLALLGLPPLPDTTESKDIAFSRAIDKAVKSLSKNIAVEREIKDLMGGTSALDSTGDTLGWFLTSIKEGVLKSLISGLPLTDEDVDGVKSELAIGAALTADAPRAEQLRYRAFSALILAYKEVCTPPDPRLDGLAYATPLDVEKKDDESTKYRPKLLKKILQEGAKYKDDAEKRLAGELLALSDGPGKAWGRFTFTISTDATGIKTYTYTDRSTTVRTFTLSAEEQKKLRDTEVESSADPEKEKKERAIREISTKYNEFLRLTKPVPADKAGHLSIFQLLLVDSRERKFVYKLDGADVELIRGQDREGKFIFLNSEAKSKGGPKVGVFERFEIAKIRAKLRELDERPVRLETPTGLEAAVGALNVAEEGKPFAGSAEQRALLNKWVSAAGKPDGAVDDGFFKKHTGITGKYEFSSDASGTPVVFFLTNDQVQKWNRIKDILPPRLPVSDALPDGVLEQSIVGKDGWENELGQRIGTKLLMGRLDMKQSQVSKEKALEYVKGLSWGKRWLLYGALALGTAAAAIGASYLMGLGIAATIGWGAAWSGKWLGLMGLKMLGTVGVALGTNWLLRKKWLDRRYGLIGTNGEPLVPFMERSKDAAGYYKALKQFRKEKKIFDTKEGKLVRARNHVRAAGTPEFEAVKYQMGMDTAMSLHERGVRTERRVQFGIPIAIGAGIAGATAWYHWDLIKSLMPGSRTTGTPLPQVTRGGPPAIRGGGPPVINNGPRGGGLVQDAYGRWIVPRGNAVYIDVNCGAPRPNCIPCDFTINGTRAHWYINSFTDTMRVSSPKGGMSYLLGNMNSIPGGRATQEQVWALFERTLCSDRDLYRTFNNIGNASRGKWIDFGVLKEWTCIGGRRQMMIDVMIERAQNANVRSTLTAMRESIIQNNPRLSVRLAR